MKERLQKIMAQANIGSRRACEELIEQKRVRVNGEVAQLGDKADPTVDVIEVDSRRITAATQRKIYIALYKPVNVITTNTANRQDKRPTVRSLVPVEGHLFSIGRLDADSEGLIVLTNDGELVNKLTHPRFKHTKTYKVSVHGLPNLEALNRWREGVFLQAEDGTTYKTSPCSVEIVKGSQEVSTLRIVMLEGKKRQIRRIASSVGHPVHRLMRTHIGKLEIGKLRPGEWRDLTAKDIELLSTPAEELREIQTRRKQARSQRGASEEDSRPGKGIRPARTQRDGMDEGERPKRRAARSTPREDAGDKPTGRPVRRRTDEDEGERPKRRSPSSAPREESDEKPRRKPVQRRTEDEKSERPKRRTPRSAPRQDSDDKPRRRPSGGPPRGRKNNDRKPRR